MSDSSVERFNILRTFGIFEIGAIFLEGISKRNWANGGSPGTPSWRQSWRSSKVTLSPDCCVAQTKTKTVSFVWQTSNITSLSQEQQNNTINSNSMHIISVFILFHLTSDSTKHRHYHYETCPCLCVSVCGQSYITKWIPCEKSHWNPTKHPVIHSTNRHFKRFFFGNAYVFRRVLYRHGTSTSMMFYGFREQRDIALHCEQSESTQTHQYTHTETHTPWQIPVMYKAESVWC